MNSKQTAIASLVEAYEKNLLCPVLGSGASVDVGLPDWERLARNLVSRRDSRVHGKQTLVNDLPWLIEMLLDGDDQSSVSLADALYGDENHEGTDWVAKGVLSRGIIWVAVLSVLIALRAPNRPFHVITYNVDLLLEEAILALGHRVEIVVPRSQVQGSPGKDLLVQVGRNGRCKVRVAHPHGVLSREGRAGSLVMTSSDYDAYTREGVTERSAVQIVAFSQLVCLFYGFSFSDWAVRRWLHYGGFIQRASRQPQPALRHLALLKGALESDTVDGHVDRELEAKLQTLRIERYGKSSYKQQRQFVRDLVEEIKKSSPPGDSSKLRIPRGHSFRTEVNNQDWDLKVDGWGVS